MRAYLMDEISSSDMKRISEFMEQHAIRSGIEGLFWVEIPPDLLTEVQKQHVGCQPHVFAVELGSDWIKCEFFVRNLRDLRCHCSLYSNPEQRNYIIDYAHRVIESLAVRT
jgi:hypothetical protein